MAAPELSDSTDESVELVAAVESMVESEPGSASPSSVGLVVPDPPGDPSGLSLAVSDAGAGADEAGAGAGAGAAFPDGAFAFVELAVSFDAGASVGSCPDTNVTATAAMMYPNTFMSLTKFGNNTNWCFRSRWYKVNCKVINSGDSLMNQNVVLERI